MARYCDNSVSLAEKTITKTVIRITCSRRVGDADRGTREMDGRTQRYCTTAALGMALTVVSKEALNFVGS